MPKLSDLLAKKSPAKAVPARSAGAVIRDGIELPPISKPSKPGPRQLDSVHRGSESIPMEHPEQGTVAALWVDVLAAFATERCLWVDGETIWLCVRAQGKRLIVFHGIPTTDPLAEYLRANLPLVKPEEIAEEQIRRISRP
jgi:hypothetical protein